MGENFYGDESQNELMYMVNKNKGDDVDMNNVEARINELNAEIETYCDAIKNAEAALDSAEKELDEVLDGLPY